MLLFRSEYKTIVIRHNVNTQSVEIARRDRPHILAVKPLNFLHTDTSLMRRTLSGIFSTLKKLNGNFYQYKYNYMPYM